MTASGSVPHLSYSRLVVYQACPYRYYLQYVLGCRTPFTAAISFGSSLHLALQDFHARMRGTPRLDELLEGFLKRWIPYGYRSREEQARYFEEGLEILRAYYLRNLFGFRPAWLVEKRFTVSLGGFEFVGIVDRLDGRPELYQVIDYKTTRHEETLRSLQLPLYSLSMKKLFGFPPQSLSYYFLRDQTTAVWEERPERLEEAEEAVARVGEGVRAGRFPATPGLACRRCDLRRSCALRLPSSGAALSPGKFPAVSDGAEGERPES